MKSNISVIKWFFLLVFPILIILAFGKTSETQSALNYVEKKTDVLATKAKDIDASLSSDKSSLVVTVDMQGKDNKTIPLKTTATAKNTTNPITIGSCGDHFCNSGENISYSSSYCPGDCPPYCGDGVCNDTASETCTSCPQDCGICPQAVCGDGHCTGTEDATNCLEDCHCGDGVCDAGEDSGTCPQECSCGNGTCDPGETFVGCPGDCHTCGNGVCDISMGETRTNCIADCHCGNGVCDYGETDASCHTDCHCGNHTCEANLQESTCSCTADCGPCGGCFLAGTPITMADSTTRSIEKIKKGDIVLSFDQKNNQFKADKVTKTFRHISSGYLVINKHLKITPNHPVLNKGTWVEIGSLKVGDTLVNEKGEIETIQSIEQISGKVKTYNIEVNPFHTYIAGGYVVHNKTTDLFD